MSNFICNNTQIELLIDRIAKLEINLLKARKALQNIMNCDPYPDLSMQKYKDAIRFVLDQAETALKETLDK